MNLNTSFVFAGGNWEFFIAVVFGFIGLMVLLYSLTRIRQFPFEFYLFLMILLGCGIGVVYARDLLLLFVFWELATVSLWRLVSYFRSDEAIDAGLWALYINFAAATLLLVALAMIQVQEGSWSLDRLSGRELPLLPAILVLVGITAKSAAVPLYIWLPRAYRQAPAGVCALLSGVAENLGLVLFYKLFVLTVRVSPIFFALSAVIAVTSSLVAGGVALTAKTIRETLAYSTVSQLGFILLGIVAGGYYGITGGLLYILTHAVGKAGLFFGLGAVEEASSTGELKSLGGWAKNSPALAGACGVLMLSIMGLPPTVGFFAKIGVLISAVQKNILYGIGALTAALFTILYLSRLFARIFLGTPQSESFPVSGSENQDVGQGFSLASNRERSVPNLTVILVVVMAVISVLTGVLWFIPVRFIAQGM
jgi:formate hydrogenlyase subunit 3/multisubunit Na+/H+ antiporter MnhD subunit